MLPVDELMLLPIVWEEPEIVVGELARSWPIIVVTLVSVGHELIPHRRGVTSVPSRGSLSLAANRAGSTADVAATAA